MQDKTDVRTGKEFSLERRSVLRLRETRMLEGIALRLSGRLFHSLGRLKRGKRLRDWSLVRGHKSHHCFSGCKVSESVRQGVAVQV